MRKSIIPGLILLIVAAGALYYFREDLPAPLRLDDAMAIAASKVLGGLFAIALVLERALAVVNDLLFGQERANAEQMLAAVRIERQAAPPGTAAAAAGAAKVVPALRAVEEVDTKREQMRLLVGLAAGFFVSAAGIRTLGDLAPDAQLDTFQSIVDIGLTAGLLAGGSNGLAKLIDILHGQAQQRLVAARVGGT